MTSMSPKLKFITLTRSVVSPCASLLPYLSTRLRYASYPFWFGTYRTIFLGVMQDECNESCERWAMMPLLSFSMRTWQNRLSRFLTWKLLTNVTHKRVRTRTRQDKQEGSTLMTVPEGRKTKLWHCEVLELGENTIGIITQTSKWCHGTFRGHCCS